MPHLAKTHAFLSQAETTVLGEQPDPPYLVFKQRSRIANNNQFTGKVDPSREQIAQQVYRQVGGTACPIRSFVKSMGANHSRPGVGNTT